MHTSYDSFVNGHAEPALVREDLSGKYRGGLIATAKNFFGARVPEMDEIHGRLLDAAQEVKNFTFSHLWSEPWRVKDGSGATTAPSREHIYDKAQNALRGGMRKLGQLLADTNQLAQQVQTFKALDYTAKQKLADGLTQLQRRLDVRTPEDVKLYGATAKLGTQDVYGYTHYGYSGRDESTGEYRMEAGQQEIRATLQDLAMLLQPKRKMTGDEALAEVG